MRKPIFTEFVDAGICTLDILETVKRWKQTWSISQWKDEYRIVCGLQGPKASISKQQAKELIVELDLMPEQSPVFRSGKTWRKSNPTTDKQQ